MNSSSIFAHFSSLSDPRIDRTKDHLLLDIIGIAICAVICGADTWIDIENYGKSKKDWLKNFLTLPNGIPSHDTFGRVFSRLSPDSLQECFLNWINSITGITDGEVIPIDGKTLRHSYDKSSKKGAIHMVSAWASENHVVLGQIKVAEKSNEITAIPKLLEILEITGCIITIDAMGCQKEIAEKIIDKDADYVLALKGNQGNLHKQVKTFFQKNQQNNFEKIDHDFYETSEKGHGRLENRKYWVVDEIDWLVGKENWKNLTTIGMVESKRTIGDKTTIEARYFISSLKKNAKLFGKAVRKHWTIENSLHWNLDISFSEDASRIRKDNAPENFARVRHIALNCIYYFKSAQKWN